MSGNKKRKIDKLDGSKAGEQSPTRRRMDFSASTPETKAKEGDAPAPENTVDASYLGGRIVTIAVGTDKVKFTVHEQALSQAAKDSFFHAAFNIGFKESVTGYLELPEEDPEIFKLALKLIYTGYAGGRDFSGFFVVLSMTTIIKLYVLAQKYLVIGIQDAIISYLHHKLQREYNTWSTIGDDKEAFDYFLAEVPETSHLYRLFVRSMAFSMLQPTDMHSHRHYIGDPDSDGVVFDCNGPSSSKEQVDNWLGAAPDEMCRSVLEVVLTVKTLGCCMSFEEVVGIMSDFLLDRGSDWVLRGGCWDLGDRPDTP